MIVLDTRWHGRHGIARFASEVIPRLRWQAASISFPASPTSPADVVAPGRLRLSSTDLVYSPGFNIGLTRARQVATLHDLIHLDDPAEQSRAKTVYYELLVKPAVRRAGTVLTVSTASQRRIERWLGGRSRVEVVNVGNGCSDAFLDRAPVAAPRRAQFLYVGNLKPHKNVEVLFAALTRRPDYRLTIVSRDAERVRALGERHAVADRVDVRSDLDDDGLGSLYQAHDAVLLPSRLEGFGLPALEALATGRRVGYSDECASVREIVGDEGVGVTDADDAEAWAAAMDRLLADGASTVVGSPGWRETYRWEKVSERVSAALERVAG